ncbi:hypothetical protein IO90_09875 [Chryseobacterium sp. FH1]|nr:hypothetical protein IO90_09875 [Chryseobacterium sp. FH1]
MEYLVIMRSFTKEKFSNTIAIDQHTKAVDAKKHFSECALMVFQKELKRPLPVYLTFITI